MTTQEQYIARLKELVEAKFGHSITNIEECDALSEVVGEATNIKLDSRAYMPIFVKTPNAIAPRPVTLSTLARYLGYNSWSEFCASATILPAADTDKLPVVRRWGVIILTSMAIVIVAGAIIFLIALAGRDTAEKSVVALQPIAENVERHWVARTLEECNSLRAYRSDSTYADRLNIFCKDYDAVLNSDIIHDLRTAIEEHGATASDMELAECRDSIAARCQRVYSVLFLEMSQQ
jgi:hypothetical protein